MGLFDEVVKMKGFPSSKMPLSSVHIMPKSDTSLGQLVSMAPSNPRMMRIPYNSTYNAYAKGGTIPSYGIPKNLRDAVELLRSYSQGNDTVLAYINPQEAHLLNELSGSSINPYTGLPQFGFWGNLWGGIRKALPVVNSIANVVEGIRDKKSFGDVMKGAATGFIEPFKNLAPVAAPIIGGALGGPGGAAAGSMIGDVVSNIVDPLTQAIDPSKKPAEQPTELPQEQQSSFFNPWQLQNYYQQSPYNPYMNQPYGQFANYMQYPQQPYGMQYSQQPYGMNPGMGYQQYSYNPYNVMQQMSNAQEQQYSQPAYSYIRSNPQAPYTAQDAMEQAHAGGGTPYEIAQRNRRLLQVNGLA